VEFVTSDNHFFHQNVIKYCHRPFSDVFEMNKKMIDRWNAVVSPEDDVYHLGDFAFSFNRTEDIFPHLNGKVHLVAGNHDSCAERHKSHKRMVSQYLSLGFKSVYPGGQFELSDQILLSHFPKDNEDPRFIPYLPKPKTGQLLLCGHVHDRWKNKGKDMINCGVDVWNFCPVRLDDVLQFQSSL
jgi:calcineurin-like phosphoesterase family protein